MKLKFPDQFTFFRIFDESCSNCSMITFPKLRKPPIEMRVQQVIFSIQCDIEDGAAIGVDVQRYALVKQRTHGMICVSLERVRLHIAARTDFQVNASRSKLRNELWILMAANTVSDASGLELS